MTWTTLISWVLSPLCAALVGVVITQAKQLRKGDEAMKDGMRVLLRQQLISYHREYVPSGKCPIEVKDQATSVYNAYHALGGNGTGTKIWEELMKLTTE